MTDFNGRGVMAIYRFELARFSRTLWTSLMMPVITTSLYFIVFGAAIGSRMTEVSDIGYGAFIVPGLIMLSMFTESLNNSSFGIYLPKWQGTIYELLSAPISPFETVLGYVGAAATKSMIIGGMILLTATFFIDLNVAHPVLMVGFMLLIAVTFCLFGFILGIWAKSFEQLQVVPLLVVYPLTFLGRCVLFHRHAAALLAKAHPAESGCLPDQWFSLDVLRQGRCLDRDQHDRGTGFFRRMPRRDILDVAKRISLEELTGTPGFGQFGHGPAERLFRPVDRTLAADPPGAQEPGRTRANGYRYFYN